MRDRRFSARVSLPFHARLKGVDTEGKAFMEDTRIEDLSVAGVRLRLTRSILEGSNVSLAVRLSVTPEKSPALRLAARGTVRRTEPRQDGTWGVAVEFTRRRVL
ncbi:MAG: hypothetical protein DMG12_11780 [Acidobacteria bacterium]|nr:MAG: hypothetical protein DMG12_11780 [Acidobacteriota bacterium]